jgi:hypothetical protein
VTRSCSECHPAGVQAHRVLGDARPRRLDPDQRGRDQRRRQWHDEFIARNAWLYVSILGGAYFISRGLAKSGSPQPYDEDGDTHR